MSQGQQRKLRGEALELEGKAHAYLSRPEEAWEKLVEAERLSGGLTLEALLLLVRAAEPGLPNASDWAASRIPLERIAGTFGEGPVARSYRRRLLCTLAARANGYS
jgi:hypothetical protein